MKKELIAIIAFSLIISSAEAQECQLRVNNQSNSNIHMLGDQQFISPNSTGIIQYNCSKTPLLLMEIQKNGKPYVRPFKLNINESINGSTSNGNILNATFPKDFLHDLSACGLCGSTGDNEDTCMASGIQDNQCICCD